MKYQGYLLRLLEDGLLKFGSFGRFVAYYKWLLLGIFLQENPAVVSLWHKLRPVGLLMIYAEISSSEQSRGEGHLQSLFSVCLLFFTLSLVSRSGWLPSCCSCLFAFESPSPPFFCFVISPLIFLPFVSSHSLFLLSSSYSPPLSVASYCSFILLFSLFQFPCGKTLGFLNTRQIPTH